MTIKEINEERERLNKEHEKEITLLNHEETKQINSLSKRITRHFRGIKPNVLITEYGVSVSIGLGTMLYINSAGISYDECVSEELATRIKNEYLEVYGEFKEHIEYTSSISGWRENE